MQERNRDRNAVKTHQEKTNSGEKNETKEPKRNINNNNKTNGLKNQACLLTIT
jgi:hypothetical protein